MTTLEDVLESALRGEGLTDDPAHYDDGIHSWRCSHPDIYGPCRCFAEMVRDVADQIRAHLLSETIIAEMAHVMASHRAQLGGWNTTGDAQHTARAALTAALDQGADQ